MDSHQSRAARPIARTSSELWHLIVLRGGLQPKRGRAGAPGYDYSFVREIADALGLAAWLPIPWELSRKRVPIEALLQAALIATQPWARMMADILAMLEAAGASHGGDGILLELDLSRFAPAMAQRLSSFRQQAEVARQVTSLAAGSLWTERGGTPLWGVIDPYSLTPDIQGTRPFWREIEEAEITPMLDWSRRYMRQDREQPGGRNDPPPFSASGVPEFDLELERLHQFLTSLVTAVRALGPTFRSRVWHDEGEREFNDGWTARAIGRAEADFAPAGVAESFERLACDKELDPDTRRAAAAVLKTKLDQAPAGPGVQDVAGRLLDLLDLPAWQRRHELYSVWVSSIIARALPAPFEWSLDHGTLSYSFGGSRLARGVTAGGSWELWAELRQPLENPVSRKRKHAIQPDYTLISNDGRSAKAALVVECKQYRVPSRRNFREALADYARGHPEAHVLLANYGPVSRAVDQDLAIDRTAPVVAMGHVRPGEPQADQFAEAVSAAVLAMSDPFDFPLARATRIEDAWIVTEVPIEIWLEWDGAADLDLHVRYRDETETYEVSYANPGRLEGYPWFRIDQDVRTGPGRETVTINMQLSGIYETEVHLFAGAWPDEFKVGLTAPGIVRILSVHPGPERTIRVFDLGVPFGFS